MTSDPRSGVPESPFLWARGIAARETLRYLDRTGSTPSHCWRRPGFHTISCRTKAAAYPSFPSAGSSSLRQSKPMIHSWDCTSRPRWTCEISASLFYLTASSATVADAFEHLARYVGTTNEAFLVEISRGKAETVVTVRHMPPFDEPRRQFSEFSTLEAMRAFSKETNRDFVPSRVTFAHARNSGLREIHRILRCPVEFVHAADSWVLPESVMELPIMSNDSHLLQILESHADDLLSERRTAAGLRGLVENRLLTVLPNGRVQAAMVADQFGMSARSFTRHLAREGTSFSEILDHVRSGLALRYLEDQRVSLQQIAWLLGYSELAAFNHAFRRWFDMSPRKARNLPASPASAGPQ
jgi:AraC-like DNA-binding protein